MPLESLKKRFKKNGSFDLGKGEKISGVLKENEVPNDYGIYLIFKGFGCEGKAIYIGLAGTVNQNGTMKPQGLSDRMKAKQDDMPRNRFFANYINEKSPEGLSFAWFVTFENGAGVLPAVAEAIEIERFYEKHKELPELNKTF